MPVFFIRHGDDYDSHPTYKHDHHITKKGLKESREFARKMISKYGHPSAVYCGPFQRTMETVESMVKAFDQHVPVLIDKRLSRYFSRTEQKRPEVASQTIKVSPPIHESWDKFKKRVKRHLKHLKNKGYFKSDKVIWCITHALVLKQVAEVFRVKLPEHFDFLEWFKVD